MPRALFHFGVVQILASGVDKGVRQEKGMVTWNAKERALKVLAHLRLQFLAHWWKGWEVLPMLCLLGREIITGYRIFETPQMEMEGP